VQYCPRSSLLLISTCDQAPDEKSFWHDVFHINDDDIFAFVAKKSVLDEKNINLSNSEKELHLWHHGLSHTLVLWIQPLMRTKKWLKTKYSFESLH